MHWNHAGILFFSSWDWKYERATDFWKPAIYADTGFLTKQRLDRCESCFISPFWLQETWILCFFLVWRVFLGPLPYAHKCAATPSTVPFLHSTSHLLDTPHSSSFKSVLFWFPLNPARMFSVVQDSNSSSSSVPWFRHCRPISAEWHPRRLGSVLKHSKPSILHETNRFTCKRQDSPTSTAPIHHPCTSSVQCRAKAALAKKSSVFHRINTIHIFCEMRMLLFDSICAP
jgi:hypothetical protein